MAWMRLPEVPSPMQLTAAGSAPGVDGLVACSRPARPRRRGSGLRRLLRASSSWRVGRSYRLTPCGGASLPCRQATTAPTRRSRQAAAGSLLPEASGGRGAGPVWATRATPMARATAATAAIVRRPHRANSRIGLPALDARPCLIGGFADQLKRAPVGEGALRGLGVGLTGHETEPVMLRNRSAAPPAQRRPTRSSRSAPRLAGGPGRQPMEDVAGVGYWWSAAAQLRTRA